MKKVSIIVPIYNSELYVSKCIESLLSQTYKNIEIVLINDGSKDSSQKIIGEYFKQYPDKIITYNQENQGSSVARNNGILFSTGDYITFVDSDDYVKNDYVEMFVKAAESSDADIVWGGFARINSQNKVFYKKVVKNNLFSKFTVLLSVAKFYKREFIIKENIKFGNNKIGEDLDFILQATCCSKKIVTIPYCGYYYFYNEKSITNTFYKGINRDIDFISIINNIYEKIYKKEIYVNETVLYEYCLIRFAIYYLLYSGRNNRKQEFCKDCKIIFEWLSSKGISYKKNKYLKIKPKGEDFKTWAIIKIFILIYRINLIKLFSKIYCKKK